MPIGKQFLEKLDHAGLSLLGDRVHCFLKGGLKTNMPFLELEIYDNISLSPKCTVLNNKSYNGKSP